MWRQRAFEAKSGNFASVDISFKTDCLHNIIRFPFSQSVVEIADVNCETPDHVFGHFCRLLRVLFVYLGGKPTVALGCLPSADAVGLGTPGGSYLVGFIKVWCRLFR